MVVFKNYLWGNNPHKQGKTYLISISFFFLCSGIILSQDIVKRPSLSWAPLTFISSAIVNDLANCLCEIPLWIIYSSTLFSSDWLTGLVLTVNKLSSNSTSTSFLLKPANATSIA